MNEKSHLVYHEMTLPSQHSKSELALQNQECGAVLCAKGNLWSNEVWEMLFQQS